MLEAVDVGTLSLDDYKRSAGAEVIAVLRTLASPLNGARVLHLNATPYGGGVAEILRSEVPLLRDLGLAADWKIITGDDSFFSVTKTMHNGLQGAKKELTTRDQETYLTYSRRNAEMLEEEYDLIVVHDPQPLALRQLIDNSTAKWIWRCHIDTSEPNQQVWGFLRQFLHGYDAAVFTLGGFVPPDFPISHIEIIPPAIDPESPKNLDLNSSTAKRVLQWIGVEIDRPLVTQVSRFDPWKDPLGVIAAYKLVKKQEVPQLQLALVGSMALDDPEGWEVYHEIQSAAKSDPEIHLFTNLNGVGNVEVNAFQRLSNVVIQKSIREGFGLVVSETLWKETPVVAGRAGGIPLQMREGAGGFLVDSIEQCAEQTLWLLQNPEEGKTLARRGKELVRERFLLPRLIADELRLYSAALGLHPEAAEPAAKAGLIGEERDPVCGRQIDHENAITVDYAGKPHYFCSPTCKDQFLSEPERFLRAEPHQQPN